MLSEKLQKLIDEVISNYEGDGRILESAIGALHFGMKLGWRPLLLIHSYKAIKRYETILGLDFKEVMPEVGPLADKSLAWRIAKKVENYWDVVRGTVKGRSAEVS